MTCAKAATLIAGAAAVMVLTATPAHADGTPVVNIGLRHKGVSISL